MKQEIKNYNNGGVYYIINKNNIGQRHGLSIDYNHNGSAFWVRNWANGKLFGLKTTKFNSKTQKYYL